MHLIQESTNLADYLSEQKEINFSHPCINAVCSTLFDDSQTDIEKAETAFTFVRDSIHHSFDIQGTHVTCKASDVLQFKQGICYAKSNLLAALLRSQGIPTGFCYQRLLLFDSGETFCIHALNAIYLASIQKWIRVDTRGNKPGVNAQFSIHKEQLAFPLNKRIGEEDYPVIYTNPNPKTIAVLTKHTSALEMYQNHLPDSL